MSYIIFVTIIPDDGSEAQGECEFCMAMYRRAADIVITTIGATGRDCTGCGITACAASDAQTDAGCCRHEEIRHLHELV